MIAAQVMARIKKESQGELLPITTLFDAPDHRKIEQAGLFGQGRYFMEVAGSHQNGGQQNCPVYYTWIRIDGFGF